MKYQALKRICAFCCLILIVAYASVILLPHNHDGPETDCTACVIIKMSSELLLGIAFITELFVVVRFIFCKLNTHFIIPFLREVTPVGLKVKLSD